MAVTGKLSRRLHETLGDEAADEMVDWMHRMDAQRGELRELNELNFSRVEARFGQASAELQGAVTRIDARFGQVEADFQAAMVRIEARFGRIEATLERHDARFDEVETALARHDTLFADLRRDMETGFARLETRIEQRTADIMKWSFVFWVGSVATLVGALVTLVRFFPG